ncbi:MAG: hypothetical protein U0796_16055 [Gemmatales bacterium]
MSLVHLQCKYENNYPPARGPVLLLSCMDLRLTDNIVQFMEHDNLVNRYDHLIFAGASLGALGVPGKSKKYAHWKQAFFEHFEAAYELRQFTDVYILEHRHCGAYHKVFKITDEFGPSDKEQQAEMKLHYEYARKLEKEIEKWARKKKVEIHVRKFLMDLRGNVKMLTKK